MELIFLIVVFLLCTFLIFISQENYLKQKKHIEMKIKELKADFTKAYEVYKSAVPKDKQIDINKITFRQIAEGINKYK